MAAPANDDTDTRVAAPRLTFRDGMLAGLPILAGALPVGIVYAVLSLDAGYSWLQTQLMSLLVYSGAAQLTTTQTIELETCDPGAQALLAPPVEPDLDPLAFPVARMSIALSILREGAKTEFARCATDHVIAQLTPDHVMAEDDRFLGEIESFGEAAGVACVHLY